MSDSGDCIPREAAIKKLDHFQSHLHTVEGTHAIGVAKTLIKEIPAADVREVVLCRDCKYWELSKIDPLFYVCTYVCGATFVREAEDFCSRGKKGEES